MAPWNLNKEQRAEKRKMVEDFLDSRYPLFAVTLAAMGS